MSSPRTRNTVEGVREMNTVDEMIEDMQEKHKQDWSTFGGTASIRFTTHHCYYYTATVACFREPLVWGHF